MLEWANKQIETETESELGQGILQNIRSCHKFKSSDDLLWSYSESDSDLRPRHLQMHNASFLVPWKPLSLVSLSGYQLKHSIVARWNNMLYKCPLELSKYTNPWLELRISELEANRSTVWANSPLLCFSPHLPFSKF